MRTTIGLLLILTIALVIAIVTLPRLLPTAAPAPTVVHSQGPTVERLERLSHLVTTRIHVVDVLVGIGEGCRGAWLIKGDALIAVKLGLAQIDVFQWLGMLPWIRLTLALMAIGIGLVHTKDFFAFKQGISLSIPESAKPGIYDRVRRIVTAENLAGAVIGAAVLAVLVNMIELLCTAGLPALYTKILSSQNVSLWGNFAYLLLYNAAYMFDDVLMVALVVITLQRRKLQETHGRWLKLVSGLVILALGLLMLVRPHWLGLES